MSVSSGEGGQAKPLDALPKVFVDSMRTLFDIMDDKRTGFVHYSDIEQRWKEEEGANVPKGVLECLRKVTPASGMLSFERFVAGLKICLLRSRAEALSQQQQQQQPSPPSQQQLPQQSQQRQPRPPSAPALDQLSGGAAAAPPPPPPAARPHSVIGQQRTLSMPQLSGAAGGDQPPPKPPRDRSRDVGGPAPPPPPAPSAANLSRTQILTALQRWHRERVQRGRGDGRDVLPPADPPSSSEAEHEAPAAPTASNPARKTAGQRKREPRRHTLQNGVDYNMLKRMKQMEQERDTLTQGLKMVERARDWYTRQLAAVSERAKYLGLGRAHQPSEHTTDANEERLSFQTARIHEVNQHLSALIDSSHRGFPLHMNLALSPGRPAAAAAATVAAGGGAPAPSATSPTTERTVRRLRAQNTQLTEEVAQRSERITALEREKASLIRELFNARSEPRRPHPDETTLI
ncbi:suppressor APC domain-containing protein 2-like [Amphibalanus amphitrite]|uniref:suppressor APC domain-containing protein 2-like n=1 Tax=Amphibalanus amphitrite TaxID=1232801 RepID=UPI001C910A1A|nr:suppressor APC domain-containing protein 2-like [Amphibalanus amphitrite]XP_043201240.1 suppressor APC domain-containing protein 2-like [Amphibalanus amphitrite]